MIRDQLSSLFPGKIEVETRNEGSPTDEEILNVLRKEERPFLRTAKFPDELGIVQRTAQKRLKQLEDEGRVRSEKIGQPKLWWLAQSEPQEPVGEAGARVLRASNNVAELNQGIFQAWIGLFGMSGFLILVFIAATAQDITFPIVELQSVVQSAFLLAIMGGVGVGMWGILKALNILLRMALERELVGTVGT